MEKYLYKELFEIEEKHWWFISKKKIVTTLLKQHLRDDENNILDIGCGSGLMLNVLKDFGKVYGMDCSDEAIKFSKLVFDGQVIKGCLPYDIPYNQNYFNVILALDVIEHIEKDKEALSVLKDYLCNNGILIITVPALMCLWSNHDVLHQHKRRYTVKELNIKIEQAGFQIERISYFNTFLFFPIFVIRQMNRKLKKDRLESDTKLPNRFINLILEKIFSFERYILKSYNMKIGVSIIAIARKINS